MRYGSVCSGIEAATVAWEPLGWQAEFYSEIEPFPSHVLHEHYSSGRPAFMPDPDEPGLKPKDRKARAAAIKAVSCLPERANGVPNHGDMTQFERWPDHAIDLLVGGTPCQDYSIAGLRAGMDGVRGSLTLTYAAIARRYRPRWLVWENVFGVLSSKGGRDFASFLGLLSGRRIEVPADGWKSAGIVEGYSGAYGLAWRVLDTQYVRVDGAPRALPQRRRRVFVVGHSGGDWRRAAAVLFEREGLSGNPAPRREPGKGVAPTIAARPTGGGGLGTDADLDGGLVAYGGGRCSGPVDVAASLAAHGNRQDFEVETFVAHTLLAKENDSHAADVDTYVAHSLRAEGFDASEDGTGRGIPIVPVAGAICRDSFTGGAGGRPEGAAAGHFVPVSIAIRGRDEGGTVEMGDDVAHALRASQGGGDKPHVLAPIAFDTKASGRNGFGVGEIAPTLRAMGHKDSHTNAGGQIGVAYPLDLRNASRDPDKRDAQNRQGAGIGNDGDPAPTLTKEFVPGVAHAIQAGALRENLASGPDGVGVQEGIACTIEARAEVQAVQTQWAVRRLTPTECARLQGFADNHCRIPWRGKPAEQCPDGPQYKAYGNSMSTNVMRWLGLRIEAVDQIVSREVAA